jgi:hypothetical protein
MCVTRSGWVFVSSYSQSGVIDILMILSKLGATSLYLYKYQLPSVEICNPHSHIYVSQGVGEFSSVVTQSPELLPFSRFRPSWEPPCPIFTSTSSPLLKFVTHIWIYVYHEGKAGFHQYLLTVQSYWHSRDFVQAGSHLALSSQIPTSWLWDLQCTFTYMCLTRARWVYIISFSQSHVIDICVILSRLGATFLYLHKYLWRQKVSGHLVFAQKSTKSHQANCGHKLDTSLTSMHYAEHYHIWQ